MATLKEHQAQAQKLISANQLEALFKFIRSIEAKLVALNREQLNKDSTDVYGDVLGFYSKATEIITKGEALLGKGTKIKYEGEPYDLEQTGKLLASIYAQLSNDVIIFGANDPKLPLVLDNPNLLSRDLFGLTDENLTMVIKQFILPFYQQHQRTTLGLKQ